MHELCAHGSARHWEMNTKHKDGMVTVLTGVRCRRTTHTCEQPDKCEYS